MQKFKVSGLSERILQVHDYIGGTSEICGITLVPIGAWSAWHYGCYRNICTLASYGFWYILMPLVLPVMLWRKRQAIWHWEDLIED